MYGGEYINGNKEYENNSHLKYEKEYLNGERNGKGKEYYNNCNILY